MGKPHGLGGAFVVEHASDDSTRFDVGTTLLVDGEPATVAESKRAGNRLVVKLDRRVERGATLAVPRSTLPEAGDDSYYVFQLVGLEVVEEDGRSLGRVRDVAHYEANDVLELDSDLLLPMVDACIKQVDVEGGRIVVAPGFSGHD